MTDQFPAGYIEATVISRILTGRVGHSEVLAATLIFLASHASSYVTAITLPVEGGMLTTCGATVTSPTKGSDRGVTAPGPLFYLTEPARVASTSGCCRPMRRCWPRCLAATATRCSSSPDWVRPILRPARCGPCGDDSDTGRTAGGWAATSARRQGRSMACGPGSTS